MMVGSKCFNFIFPVILIGLLVSCANVRPPGGGPVDTIPPLMIASNPVHESLNFEGNKISLQFDERLLIDNLNNKLIITPRLDEDFDYKTGKYDVIIILNEELKDSTTYTFNFADAVKDITEGNPAENAVIAFSTGDYLDSLTFRGIVSNIFTNQPIAGSVVALYEISDTLDIFSGQPRYFTRTNELGEFKLENIKNVPFRIYSFLDGNRNLKSESNREKYGFLANPIDPEIVSDSVTYWKIPIQKLDISDLKLIGNRPTGRYYELAFSKPLLDYRLSQNTSDTLFSNFIDENRAIRIYQTFTIADSLAVTVQATDSIGFQIDTLFYVQFEESKRKASEFREYFNPANQAALDNNFKGFLSFNKPIIHVNYDSIFIVLDSVEILKINPQTDVEWNKYRTKVIFKKYIEPESFQQAFERKTEVITQLRVKAFKIDSLVKAWRSDTLGTFVGYDPDTLLIDPSNPPQTFLPLDAPTEPLLPPSLFKLYVASGSFITVDYDSSSKIERLYSFKNSRNYGVIRGTVISEQKSYIIQLLNDKYEVIKEAANSKDYEFVDISPGNYRIRVLIDTNGL